MTTRIELPSGSCLGLDMPDGTRYDARDGHIEVERADHAAAILSQREVRASARVYGYQGLPGATCGGCGFETLAALAGRPCPRCGGRFDGDEEG